MPYRYLHVTWGFLEFQSKDILETGAHKFLILGKLVTFWVDIFSLCDYYFPFEKCMSLYLNWFEFPLPKKTVCQVRLNLAQLFCRGNFPKIVSITGWKISFQHCWNSAETMLKLTNTYGFRIVSVLKFQVSASFRNAES